MRIFTQHNLKGVRGLRDHLRLAGHMVNEKRVRLTGHEPGTPYPYLLREHQATAPSEVWSTDITYVPMAKDFRYLAAVLDWHSRYVLSWQLSNTLDMGFCLLALADALRVALAPHIYLQIPTSTASLRVWPMSRPYWSLDAAPAATAGAASPIRPSSNASGARSNGSTSTSILPTTAFRCTTNYKRTLPTTITADPTKA